MDRVKEWEDKEILTHSELNAEFDNITDNADLQDAVTKKHAANTDTALGAQSENLNMNMHKITGVGGVTIGSYTDAGDNNLRVEGVIVGSHDDITATSEGVAASIATETTFVTTNGDSDLDNDAATNGTEGQAKHIACIVEGNAADTWKITPANMVGGTQITFAGIGEGCILKMYLTGWVVISNSGGTIS